MPMAYVRNKVKDHGRAKHIEGKLSYADPIVIVEDLISTGSSSIEVLNILKKDGYKVLGIVSIFSYNTKKAINNFKNAKVKCFSLTRLDELVSVALKKGIINKVQSKTIIKFRNSL
jgi:orotate phosphoribosyltransferase